MSSRKWLPNFIFLLSLINFIFIAKSQFPTQVFIFHTCLNNGNYSSNSTYKKNLDTLLSSISSNIDGNGFYNASIGENPDRVNVMALCRADVQPYQCRNSIEYASGEIIKRCGGRKQAILWHEFCMVRYSNKAIYGTVAFSPNRSAYGDGGFSPETDMFYREVSVLLDSLHNKTAYNSSPMKFAAGSSDNPYFRTIFAFEQCTPDVTPDECIECLRRSTQWSIGCCGKAIGVRILLPSCYLRWETNPFYNETRVQSLIDPLPPLPPPLPSPQPPSGKDDKKTRNIFIVVVPIVVCLTLVVCIAVIVRIRLKNKGNENLETDHTEITTVESLRHDFGMIRAATDNFSDANKLGQGGFGAVYKGKLANGQEIAVKRLSRDSGQGDLEFRNEVMLVAKLQHRNLVRLLGFSIERSERLLVYEFFRNGSLDHVIFDQAKRFYLNWDKRYKIIGGIARGLLYLHEDSQLRIIHRDLKASNVLLDDEMNPKISDFGMAKLFGQDETHGNTNKIVGTYGYMAPEYAMQGQFSSKSDVFSFGVLVLEILTGQKVYNFQNGENQDNLLICAWKHWHEGTALDLIDPTLMSSSTSSQDIIRCIHIGLLCVQENAADRPTMASVVLMLTSFSITLSVPSRPAFFMSSILSPEVPLLEEHNSRQSQNRESSKSRSDNSVASSNDVSMSELYPR